jgi:hypothetical protein
MIQHVFGSAKWVESVFSSPDARKVWGRSRPTQRYAIAGADRAPIFAEGGNEATARALMILGTKTGQIKRWKFQPFALTKDFHGIKGVPDLMFEMHDSKLFVSEPRSSRFLTHERLEKALKIESVINETGRMRYLFWTDAWPLVPATTRLVHELRRCGTSAIPRSSIEGLQTLLESGSKTFFELRERNCFRDIVMAAVWHGKAHINLFEPVTDSTIVSKNVATRRFENTLCAPVSAQTVWHQMERVTPIRTHYGFDARSIA